MNSHVKPVPSLGNRNAANNSPVTRFAIRWGGSACKVSAVIVRHHSPSRIARLSATPESSQRGGPNLCAMKKALKIHAVTYNETVENFSSWSAGEGLGRSFSSASNAASS